MLSHQYNMRIIAVALLATAAVLQAEPVKLIIDTDAGFDVDDIGALAVGNALQDNGEADIIAVGHTNGFVKGIGAVSSVMDFYGRNSVPLGAYKGPWAQNPNAGKGTADRYVSDLVDNYPSPVKNSTQTPTAVSNYRRVLASQPDNSVHIASIGITTNMRDLIQSKPDNYSVLSGFDLVKAKVKMIVWMDMMYNFGCAQHDTDDWLGPDTDCRGSAQAAVMGWPSTVKQIFSPVGGDVLHGDWLTGCAGTGNPVRQAFEDWLGPNNGRSSWDPIAVLIAVRGASGVHCKEVGQGGHNVVDVTGKETWVDGTSSNQSRIEYDGPVQSSIQFELNELLCKPPGPWSSNWTAAIGENCYGPRGTDPAHGATDLENPPSSSCGVMSLAECQQKCINTSGCTGVTVSSAGSGKYNCYRKADLSLRHCDSGTSFDTYVRRNWYLAGGFNCYTGHGALDIDGGKPCGYNTVRECQQICETTPTCSAVVWQGGPHNGFGSCYRKSNIVLSKCDSETEFDTYISNL